MREVLTLESGLTSSTEDELRSRAQQLRRRAQAGSKPVEIAVEAFALMREASRRALGLQHFAVQLFAGAALCDRTVIEMQTGEGKTLTAGLPLSVFGLYGRGALLATSNDYLAERDADRLRPAFALLGMTVGVVTAEKKPAERREAYACDVTYGTGKEFGFDFLRDRLRLRAAEEATGELVERCRSEPRDPLLQRAPYFVLVDEADSVLIDDAGTPLIIAAASRPVSEVTGARFRTAADVASRFEPRRHFIADAAWQQVALTAAGRELLRSLPWPDLLRSIPWPVLYEDVERAIGAAHRFKKDTHYVVCDDEVHIVDEFTGRIAEGRKWRDGLHQAVEAREKLPITDDGGQAARITVQEFFLRFPALAGMTGTASTAAREFKRIYRLPVVVVPTNLRSQRRRFPTLMFDRADEKWAAVVDDVRQMSASGRPVLIGTRSIEKSLSLSELLLAAALDHVVLNARETAREAEIVAEAGRSGRITVATNMAGRGTDIKLTDEASAAGGLHVILTEMQEAARIDRQFVGRGARQGDPGSYRLFLARDDELLRVAGDNDALNVFRIRFATERTFLRAQRRLERRLFLGRSALLQYERRRRAAYKRLGFDPYLDLTM